MKLWVSRAYSILALRSTEAAVDPFRRRTVGFYRVRIRWHL